MWFVVFGVFFCVFMVLGLIRLGNVGMIKGDSFLVIVDFKGGIMFGFYFLIWVLGNYLFNFLLFVVVKIEIILL